MAAEDRAVTGEGNRELNTWAGYTGCICVRIKHLGRLCKVYLVTCGYTAFVVLSLAPMDAGLRSFDAEASKDIHHGSPGSSDSESCGVRSLWSTAREPCPPLTPIRQVPPCAKPSLQSYLPGAPLFQPFLHTSQRTARLLFQEQLVLMTTDRGSEAEIQETFAEQQ